MKKLHHPNLLQLYAVCTMDEPILIITELVKHGNLLEYMRTGAGRDLTFPKRIDMMIQIASGKYLQCTCLRVKSDHLLYSGRFGILNTVFIIKVSSL